MLCGQIVHTYQLTSQKPFLMTCYNTTLIIASLIKVLLEINNTKETIKDFSDKRLSNLCFVISNSTIEVLF